MLYRALARILDMLASTDEVMAAADVQEHLAASVERLGEQARFDGPTRAEFEEICSHAPSGDRFRRRPGIHG